VGVSARDTAPLKKALRSRSVVLTGIQRMIPEIVCAWVIWSIPCSSPWPISIFAALVDILRNPTDLQHPTCLQGHHLLDVVSSFPRKGLHVSSCHSAGLPMRSRRYAHEAQETSEMNRTYTFTILPNYAICNSIKFASISCFETPLAPSDCRESPAGALMFRV
jgi:hypothetical protein